VRSTATAGPWLCMLMLAACADSDPPSQPLADGRARACVREHPTSDRDQARALARTSAECLDANQSCESLDDCNDECAWKSLISQEAAVCIARADGFAEGIAQVTASLRYSERLGRPSWSLQNTVFRENGTGESGGATVTIDAATGAILERGAWEAQP
jgi:hypothetical protein